MKIDREEQKVASDKIYIRERTAICNVAEDLVLAIQPYFWSTINSFSAGTTQMLEPPPTNAVTESLKGAENVSISHDRVQ